MRRRGLEPPPGYPGTRPSTRSNACPSPPSRAKPRQTIRRTGRSGRVGRHGRSQIGSHGRAPARRTVATRRSPIGPVTACGLASQDEPPTRRPSHGMTPAFASGSRSLRSPGRRAGAVPSGRPTRLTGDDSFLGKQQRAGPSAAMRARRSVAWNAIARAALLPLPQSGAAPGRAHLVGAEFAEELTKPSRRRVLTAPRCG